jgi:hypothetical protein
MADGRTQIRVRLTAEGSAILGGIAWAVLDLAPGFSTRVSKDVNQLSDVNQLLTDGVLSFSVPFSTTNDAAFLSFSSPIITDNIDTGIDARIIVDSHELPFDRVWIKEKNDVAAQWEIEVRRSPNHWLELASTKKLCDIDLGMATLDAATVADGWAAQFYGTGSVAVERWLPVDYGGWVDLAEPIQFTDPPVKTVWLEDLRPWISKPYLLIQGFCEIGWTLAGQILDAFWVKAQFDYLLSREYYTQSKGGLHKLIGQLVIGTFTPNSVTAIPLAFDSIQYDPGGNFILITTGIYAAGIVNNLPFKSKYRFVFQGSLENTSGSPATYGIGIGEYDAGLTGLTFFDVSYNLAGSEVRYVTIDQTVDLEPGQAATFIAGASSNVIFQKGFRIVVEPANNSLVRGDVVTLNRLINCDYVLLDYFKGFVHEIGGRVETDWANRTVTVHPYRTADVFGDSVPGFVLDGEAPIDIDGKIVCESIRMSRVKNTLSRYTQLQFADTTDAYIQSLELPQPAFSRKVLNSIELPDQVQELKNPFFEPTLEGRPETLKKRENATTGFHPMAYMPRLWDNMNGERSFVIGPRTVMFFGDVSQLDEKANDFTWFYFEDTVTAIFHFGYASQLTTLPHHPTMPPTMEGTVVYGTTNSDLYVTFYLGALQGQKRGAYMDALVLLDSNDYAAWNFRTLFSFVYQGRRIIAAGERISDFAHALDTPTPMRLLVDPSDTQCCDLPCSCRFTECDYYQDFGQYMTQDTLDDLSVTSFKVNEIEQLTAPVDFGIINIVEFSGKQFVTNLVDTLNDLAIDYFTFRPSTKDYPEKLDARYFKIKRPACWGFEIIISDGGGEVYRYRDFDMAQQWFDVSWTAMGYGSNPISEPADCVTTIEY